MNHKNILLFLVTVLFVACDKGPFDIHPYDVHITGATNLNATNIAKIENACKGKDTLRVAFISDTHLWVSQFQDEVNDINRRKDSIDFVVHCGDITDTGTTREYEWTRKILEKLERPHVVLIGNHDFLGTGDQVYENMYGDLDFSFIAGTTKFVCLNTNATEYDYLAAVPNFDYIDEQIHADSAKFNHTVVCMHAGPGSDQFNNNVKKMFGYIINLFPGLYCCLYGHDHHFNASDMYDNGTMWYEIASAQAREYLLFTFTPNGYSYERIHF
ncbi:MAG: metallophosphoesterase [Prevotella sp.]|nr:metallophosphoesterase [Prevotella sp.]